MMKDKIERIRLCERTPTYEGASELVRFDDRYFRTQDSEGYSSWLSEITKEEFERLKLFKEKNDGK